VINNIEQIQLSTTGASSLMHYIKML